MVRRCPARANVGHATGEVSHSGEGGGVPGLRQRNFVAAKPGFGTPCEYRFKCAGRLGPEGVRVQPFRCPGG